MIHLVECDGCEGPFDPTVEPRQFHIFMERGVQVRYCTPCAQAWSDFEAAHNAMAARYNRQLEAWAEETRARLPLKLTPLDFPALAATEAGALRLG